MKKSRYIQLDKDVELHLTAEEIKEGWHFCMEWDGLLIHETWVEHEACLGWCKKVIETSC